MRFCIDFWNHFDPNLPPKIDQNREKSMLRRTLSSSRFLDWFLMHFGTQLGSQNSKKTNEKQMVLIVFRENRPFEVNIDSWHDFGANLAPFSLPKSIKVQKKSFWKGIYFLIDFFIDFFSILARFWEPTCRHVGLDFALKGHPNASQDALESENPPRPPPDLDFHRFLVDFLSIFHRFSIDFSMLSC